MQLVDKSALDHVTGGFDLGPFKINAPFTFAPGGSPTVNVNSGDAHGNGQVNVGSRTDGGASCR
jgi:hypothetical protein